MASVRRRGPLLRGCDGKMYGWQYEAGQATDPRSAADHGPKLSVALASYITRVKTFCSEDAAVAVGRSRNTVNECLGKFVARGLLRRYELPREGRGGAKYQYEVTHG